MEINNNDINNQNHTQNYFHWQQRPKIVQDHIDSVFRELSTQNQSNWGAFNGSESYTIAEIKDQLLIKQILSEGVEKGQIEFSILEIGAGNFQWEVNLANFINKQEGLASKIKVHIFGVRGEGGEEKIETYGACTIYKMTAFKVENLVEEFRSRGFFLEEKLILLFLIGVLDI